MSARRRTAAGDQTVQQRPYPVVVVVGGSPALLKATRFAASLSVLARVEPSELASAATTVAKWRPFAIVMPSDLYEFDPNEFKALARDVNASLLRVPPSEQSDKVLATMLAPELKRAAERRGLLA